MLLNTLAQQQRKLYVKRFVKNLTKSIKVTSQTKTNHCKELVKNCTNCTPQKDTEDMAKQQFEKGDARINRKGRKAGTPNKSTNELRLLVQSFVEENWQTVQGAFDKLDDKDKLNFIEKLLKHTLPAPLTELERLTDEQLDTLIHKLKQQQHEHITKAQN